MKHGIVPDMAAEVPGPFWGGSFHQDMDAETKHMCGSNKDALKADEEVQECMKKVIR